MNPFKVKEVHELSRLGNNLGNTIKSFEKSNQEAKLSRHITTLNNGLEGKKYLNTQEVTELSRLGNKLGYKIRAFENSNHEVKLSQHITTINEDLEGKKYPNTNVEYKKHTFLLNGKLVDGVFPKFHSKFDTVIPKDMFNASDNEQFKYCTERLKKRIQADPLFALTFTPRQREQIKNGAPRISGLTWHHNEVPGKMQLVKSSEHSICRHTGGRSIWGGGSDCR